MPIPPKLMKKYLDRFDELIQEGDQLAAHCRQDGEGVYRDHDYGRHEVWIVNSKTLLDQILPAGHVHRKYLNELGDRHRNLQSGLLIDASRLKALHYDLANDFLGDIAAQIESEIAADYMGQADGLLAEGHRGSSDHVPAAVLAGAVLEHSLRAACADQVPGFNPEKTVNGRTSKKMMNDLIEEAKGAGIFNETRAAQLRAWAAIRNRAAHGEFDQFTRAQVEEMVSGIKTFLAEVLG